MKLSARHFVTLALTLAAAGCTKEDPKAEPKAAAAVEPAKAEGWITLFNGKDLSGWKSNAATDDKNESGASVFTVENGELKVSGGRAHLFYVGPDGNASFKNFEVKAKVKTTPGSNSGFYFHTRYQDTNWPDAGYECQVNSTHKDPKKNRQPLRRREHSRPGSR